MHSPVGLGVVVLSTEQNKAGFANLTINSYTTLIDFHSLIQLSLVVPTTYPCG